MKRFLSFAAAAIFMTAVSLPAMAQGMTNPAAVQCGALSGSPFVCIKNASQFPVTDITTVLPSSWGGFNPNTASWIHIPGGAVQPGGTTIVKFNTSFFGPGCVQNIVVRMASGQTHMFPSVNVCNSTSLVLQW